MSQHVDKDLIEKLAHLSRIHTTPEEMESLVNDLERIVTYVEQLQSLDTEDYPPCHHVSIDAKQELVNVMRDDEIAPPLPREKYLSNAPDQIAGTIRIPSWLKQEIEE